MPKANKYNWEMIKDWYVKGKYDLATGDAIDYSYQDVCDQWGVKSRSNVKRHADKEGWNEARAEYKEQLRGAMRREAKEVQIPDIVRLKRTIINMHYKNLQVYAQKLDAGEVDIKPRDAMDSANFLINEYKYLFGIEEPAQKVEVDVKFKDANEIFDLLARIRNGSSTEDSDRE